MSVPIPAAAADLFTGKALAHIATVGPKGHPLVSPVWIDREGDRILVNSTKARVKSQHMKPGAKVALSIMDAASPFRYLGVQGVVVEVRTAGADEHIDRLAQRYLGKSPYPWRQPGDVRQIFVIEPLRIKLQG